MWLLMDNLTSLSSWTLLLLLILLRPVSVFSPVEARTGGLCRWWVFTLYIFSEFWDELVGMRLDVELFTVPCLNSIEFWRCGCILVLEKSGCGIGPVSGSGYSEEPEWLMPSSLYVQRITYVLITIFMVHLTSYSNIFYYIHT